MSLPKQYSLEWEWLYEIDCVVCCYHGRAELNAIAFCVLKTKANMQFTPSLIEHEQLPGMVSKMILHIWARATAMAMSMTKPYHRKSLHIIQANGPYSRYDKFFRLARFAYPQTTVTFSLYSLLLSIMCGTCSLVCSYV